MIIHTRHRFLNIDGPLINHECRVPYKKHVWRLAAWHCCYYYYYYYFFHSTINKTNNTKGQNQWPTDEVETTKKKRRKMSKKSRVIEFSRKNSHPGVFCFGRSKWSEWGCKFFGENLRARLVYCNVKAQKKKKLKTIYTQVFNFFFFCLSLSLSLFICI